MKIGDYVRVIKPIKGVGYQGTKQAGDVGRITSLSTGGIVRLDYEHGNCWIDAEFLEPVTFTTKPISYEGCDPVIAEHLKRGEAILCEVWNGFDSERSQQEFVTGWDLASSFPYRTEYSVFKHATPYIAKPKLKPLLECFRLLIENGFEMDSCGNWKKEGYNLFPDWIKAYEERATYPEFLLEE